MLLHSMPLGHLGFYVGWVWSGKLHWVGVFFVEKSYSRCTAATEEGVLWGGASGLLSNRFFAYVPESFIPVKKNIRKKQWISLGIQWMLVSSWISRHQIDHRKPGIGTAKNFRHRGSSWVSHKQEGYPKSGIILDTNTCRGACCLGPKGPFAWTGSFVRRLSHHGSFWVNQKKFRWSGDTSNIWP